MSTTTTAPFMSSSWPTPAGSAQKTRPSVEAFSAQAYDVPMIVIRRACPPCNGKRGDKFFATKQIAEHHRRPPGRIRRLATMDMTHIAGIDVDACIRLAEIANVTNEEELRAYPLDSLPAGVADLRGAIAAYQGRELGAIESTVPSLNFTTIPGVTDKTHELLIRSKVTGWGALARVNVKRLSAAPPDGLGLPADQAEALRLWISEHKSGSDQLAAWVAAHGAGK